MPAEENEDKLSLDTSTKPGKESVVEDKVESARVDSEEVIDLENPEHAKEKNHFLMVVKTVLSNKVCSDNKDLKWTKKYYEKHHDHKHSKTASSRSALHVEQPKPLDEKKIQDMTVILTELSDRYLTLLAENLSDSQKEEFLDAKRSVEQMSCSEVVPRKKRRN